MRFCDCGDTIHGTHPAQKTQGEALVPILNWLGLDAMTAHWQFAYGPETFKQCAAKQVGVTGSVVGIDINPGILEVANSVTSQEIVIEWHEANIERIPFPENSFDIVLCQMGLQFIPDKLAALKEIHRVLRNGGRFIFNLPRPTPQLFAYMQEAFEKTIHDKFEFLNQVFSLHY